MFRPARPQREPVVAVTGSGWRRHQSSTAAGRLASAGGLAHNSIAISPAKSLTDSGLKNRIQEGSPPQGPSRGTAGQEQVRESGKSGNSCEPGICPARGRRAPRATRISGGVLTSRSRFFRKDRSAISGSKSDPDFHKKIDQRFS